MQPATPVATNTTGSAQTLVFSDPLPDTQDELNAALLRQNVQLESVMLRAPLVFCTVRVKNISFQKSVFVRVTSDNWATQTDVEASYFPGSSDGRSDRFYVSTVIIYFFWSRVHFFGFLRHAIALRNLTSEGNAEHAGVWRSFRASVLHTAPMQYWRVLGQ